MESATDDDLNSEDHTGMTPLDLAAVKGRQSFFEFLWKRGAKPSRTYRMQVLEGLRTLEHGDAGNQSNTTTTSRRSRDSTSTYRERMQRAIALFQDGFVSIQEENEYPHPEDGVLKLVAQLEPEQFTEHQAALSSGVG